MIKSLLKALIEPTARLRTLEDAGDYTGRLVLLEELKTLPFGAVWERYCEAAGVPSGPGWLGEINRYERDVLALRR
jgi:L-rhamnose isomerase